MPSPRLTSEDDFIFTQHKQLLDYTDYVRNVVTGDMYAELPFSFEEWLENDCPKEPFSILNV